MILHYTAVDSPLGRLYLARNDQGLIALTLGTEAKKVLFDHLEKRCPNTELMASKSHFIKEIKQLDEYFKGQRSKFDLELNLSGTPFQLQVWKTLRTIPYGKTIAYGDLAKMLNNPGGMRAVGAANGQNPIPIIIPCHRVIAADGSLGGYTGGLDIKRKLLDLEQQKFTPTLF